MQPRRGTKKRGPGSYRGFGNRCLPGRGLGRVPDRHLGPLVLKMIPVSEIIYRAKSVTCPSPSGAGQDCSLAQSRHEGTYDSWVVSVSGAEPRPRESAPEPRAVGPKRYGKSKPGGQHDRLG